MYVLCIKVHALAICMATLYLYVVFYYALYSYIFNNCNMSMNSLPDQTQETQTKSYMYSYATQHEKTRLM